MNKRIRNTAFVCACVSIVLVLAIVYGINWMQNGLQSQTASEGPPTTIVVNEVQAALGEKPFLNDGDFLDEYQPFAGVERDNSAGTKVFLLTTSVARDLRVTIIDENGKPVTGVNFYVNVSGAGEYKDLDQDGVIYIGGLKAGDYYVSLKEVQGYEVPTEETKVTVKDQIQYAMISDISYLIKTEEEINAEEEDTSGRDAGEDADDTEYTGLKPDSADAVLGIDVSKWNGSIDWNAVSADGVKFAIIRCGYRGSKTGALVEDPYFLENLEGASQAGIQVGIYFFTQALNEVEAVEEASMVLSLLSDKQIQYPIFIDTESSGGRADSLGVLERTGVCTAFCKTIEGAGYPSGVYASRNWYYNKVDDDTLSQYKIWLAEYRSTPLYTGRYDYWQYTSSGSINGIQGRVDLNLGYLVTD